MSLLKKTTTPLRGALEVVLYMGGRLYLRNFGGDRRGISLPQRLDKNF